MYTRCAEFAVVAMALCLGLGCTPNTSNGVSQTEPKTSQPKASEPNKPVDSNVKVDDKLPEYKAVTGGVTGTIKTEGSDTMNNLLALWGQEFKKFYPAVQMEIQGKGSGTAPPALIEGAATFGPMSREMNKDEVAKFEDKFGYKPTHVRAAIDTLAVFVH